MVSHASLFSQLIALFDRGVFHNLVYQHKAKQFSKGFNSWDHFVAMLFCLSLFPYAKFRRTKGGCKTSFAIGP